MRGGIRIIAFNNGNWRWSETSVNGKKGGKMAHFPREDAEFLRKGLLQVLEKARKE